MDYKKGIRTAGVRTAIVTKTKEITDACCSSIEVGTTGYRGGDAGHGGFTYLKFVNDGGLFMQVKTDELGEDYFEVVLGGDAELRSIIKALKFAVFTLEEQIEEDELC